MILFVRATDGQIDYIAVHHEGVGYTPELGEDGIYYSPVGDFKVTVDDQIIATLYGTEPDEWSLCNDLHRFIFYYPETEPIDALDISVIDGIVTSDRLN